MIKKKYLLLRMIFLCAFLSVIQAKYIYAANEENNNNSPAKSTVKLKEDNVKFLYLEAFSKALNILESQYVDPKLVRSDILIEKAIKGMAAELDPHTTYLTPYQLEFISGETSGKFGGIGIVVNKSKNKIQIIDIIEGSPAQKAGLNVGDIITSIDNQLIDEQNVEKIMQKIRGVVGTNIILKYYTPAPNDSEISMKEITLTRQYIKSKNLEFIPLAQKYFYAKLEIFYQNAADDLSKKIKEFKLTNKEVAGFVFDLRDNPGGLLDEAVKVTNLFLDSGIIVSTIGRDKAQPEDVEYALKRNAFEYFPMIVLVNEKTASASEIVAGALQDRERAIVMGVKTFGKGSVQSIVNLPNKGALKVTIARYYTPNGRSIQVKGIIPDIIANAAQSASKSDKDPKPKREEDLKKHIEIGEDQLTALNRTEGVDADFAKWPLKLSSDEQIKNAYVYLRNFSKIKDKIKK